LKKLVQEQLKDYHHVFNCGDKKHGIRECKTPKDQNCIQLNIYLKREYEQSVNPVLKKLNKIIYTRYYTEPSKPEDYAMKENEIDDNDDNKLTKQTSENSSSSASISSVSTISFNEKQNNDIESNNIKETNETNDKKND